MISDILFIVLPLADGIGLSILYFGGLWLTVQILPVSKHPTLLAVGSFLGRIVVALFGFYFAIVGGHWERLLVCMSGFLLVRIILINRLQLQHIDFGSLIGDK